MTPQTVQVYASHLRALEQETGVPVLSLTPNRLVQFLETCPGRLAPLTVTGRLSAVRWAFHSVDQIAPVDHPMVGRAVHEFTKASRHTPRRVGRLTYDDMLTVVSAIPTDTKGLRDAALLLVGWWGRLEPAALGALRVSDVSLVAGGRWMVEVRQFRQPRRVLLERNGRLDAWGAVQRWVDESDVIHALFPRVGRWGHVMHEKPLSGEAVRDVVKERVAVLPVDPADYGGRTLHQGPDGLDDPEVSRLVVA